MSPCCHEFILPDQRLLTVDEVDEVLSVLLHRVLHWPGCTIGQTTNRGTGHRANVVCYFRQLIEIAQFTFASANAAQDLRHPGRPFPAWRTLTTRFMAKEPATIKQHIHHAGSIIYHHQSCCAQTQTALLDRIVEVELTAKSRFSEETHADTTGHHGFGLATLPYAKC